MTTKGIKSSGKVYTDNANKFGGEFLAETKR